MICQHEEVRKTWAERREFGLGSIRCSRSADRRRPAARSREHPEPQIGADRGATEKTGARRVQAWLEALRAQPKKSL